MFSNRGRTRSAAWDSAPTELNSAVSMIVHPRPGRRPKAASGYSSSVVSTRRLRRPHLPRVRRRPGAPARVRAPGEGERIPENRARSTRPVEAPRGPRVIGVFRAAGSIGSSHELFQAQAVMGSNAVTVVVSWTAMPIVALSPLFEGCVGATSRQMVAADLSLRNNGSVVVIVRRTELPLVLPPPTPCGVNGKYDDDENRDEQERGHLKSRISLSGISWRSDLAPTPGANSHSLLECRWFAADRRAVNDERPRSSPHVAQPSIDRSQTPDPMVHGADARTRRSRAHK
jgi:hypothetical protein